MTGASVAVLSAVPAGAQVVPDPPPAPVTGILPSTSILDITGGRAAAPPASTSAAPAPAGATATPAPAPEKPIPTALLRLVAGWLGGRRDLLTRQGDAQRASDGARADLAAARGRLDRAAADRVDRADRLVEVAGSITDLEADLPRLTAAAVPVADLRRTTPVAHPPAPGHDPEAEAARGRATLAAAQARLADLRRQVRDQQRQLDAASVEADVDGSTVETRAEAADGRRRALEEIQQQVAADDGSAVARIGRALTTEGGGQVAPTPAALDDIPSAYLDLYNSAAAGCPGLSWAVLAAVGSIESDHGRLASPGVRSGANLAGAMGPMQFLAGTWDAYGADGDGDGVRDVYNPADAVSGAAGYLCASGGGTEARLSDAIFAYNHAGWYVAEVVERAIRYGAGDSAEVAGLVRRAAAS